MGAPEKHANAIVIAPAIESMYAIHCSDALLLCEAEHDPRTSAAATPIAEREPERAERESLMPATARTGLPSG